MEPVRVLRLLQGTFGHDDPHIALLQRVCRGRMDTDAL